PATLTRQRAEYVGAPVLDLLPLHLQAELAQRLAQQRGARLLRAGERWRRDEPECQLDQAALVDHERKCGRTSSPKRRICSCRSAPHSSSMTCVQPAARYS